ncbi:MAG: response regulator transcription factor [Polyangiales bacterium]|jgi:two-component system OmpR family response regulator
MRCTVGLVEDDDVIRENYADFLQARGFGVRAFADRLTALDSFRVDTPDVAVLDVALGEERDGGLLLCSEIRRFSQTLPVIFLTCHDNEVDRISGLRVGGDDYLSKESSFEFLAVRIETLLERRRAVLESDPDGGPTSNVVVGDLSIDLRRAEVKWKGEPVRLSLTQYWMVLALASAQPQPKSAPELMRAANISVASNTVAVHIRSVRGRFTAIDPEFDAIRTERGHGYRWVL